MSSFWLNVRFGIYHLQAGDPRWWSFRMSQNEHHRGKWFQIYRLFGYHPVDEEEYKRKLYSKRFFLHRGNTEADFQTSLLGLLVLIGHAMTKELEFPITIELELQRKRWDLWIEAEVVGTTLDGERDWEKYDKS